MVSVFYGLMARRSFSIGYNGIRVYFMIMIVEILKTDKRLGVKAGQIYQAEKYWLDPDKVTLLRRLTKKERKPIGKEPLVNQYTSDVRVLQMPYNSLLKTVYL